DRTARFLFGGTGPSVVPPAHGTRTARAAHGGRRCRDRVVDGALVVDGLGTEGHGARTVRLVLCSTTTPTHDPAWPVDGGVRASMPSGPWEHPRGPAGRPRRWLAPGAAR